MINVSFYLLTPRASSQSNLYVSISAGGERLRFNTGFKLITEYCNLRGKKGQGSLIKEDTRFTESYNKLLRDIRDVLIDLDNELLRKGWGSNLGLVELAYQEIRKEKILLH